MDENKLKQWWVNSSQHQKVEINAEKLMQSINMKLSKMERLIRKRDRLEIIISIAMIGLFGWWTIVVPKILVKVGSAIILAGCLLVIFRLLNARRIKETQDAASDIKNNLLVSLERVNRQINLLDTVLWWYLFPFFVGIVCIFYAYLKTLLSLSIYTLIVAVLYGYIWYMNKKAVRKYLRPLQENLIKALDELSHSE